MITAVVFTVRIELDHADDTSHAREDCDAMVETLEDIFSPFEDRKKISFNIERAD